MPDLSKLKLFCKENATMSYKFKKKVLQIAILSSLLYGCEGCLTEQISKIEKLLRLVFTAQYNTINILRKIAPHGNFSVNMIYKNLLWRLEKSKIIQSKSEYLLSKQEVVSGTV